MKWLDVLLGRLRPRPPAPPPPDTAADLLELHNTARFWFAYAPLTLHPLLSVAAQSQAERMAAAGRLSHEPALADRLGLVAYAYRACGENVAEGQQTPQEVFDDWFASSGHRANVLRPDFRHAGFGRAGRFWCAVFASPR